MAKFNATQYAIHLALQQLNQEGVLVSHVGRGTVVASHDEAVSVKPKADQPTRVLLLHYRSNSKRNDLVSDAIHHILLERGCRVVSVAYKDDEDLNAMRGEGQFDFCVVQPRRSILSTRLIDIARRNARYVIVEGQTVSGTEFDGVVRDQPTSLRLAIRHLSGLGHTRLGLVCEDGHGGTVENDIEQLFDFWSEVVHGTDVVPFSRRPSQDPDNTTQSNIDQVLTDWRDLPDAARPTALIICGSFQADYLQQAFDAANILIPDDLSIVRVCSTSVEALHGGVFTTVGRKSESIAEALADLIEWRTRHPKEAQLITRAFPDVIERKSSAQIG